MQVIRADYAGACYGVQRALDMAYASIKGGKRAYTLGPLIHNPQAVAQLEQAGIEAADTLEEIPATDTVIIRSHGVTPQVMREVKERKAPLLNATCPFVLRAQNAASDLGKRGLFVIVVGEEGHPEVEGLVAHAREQDAQVVVAMSAEDLPLEINGPVGVVVQTTQRIENLKSIIAELKRRGIEPVVENTICTATRQRQDAAADLASSVDAMVVIGGRNSANTTRLAEICKKLCPQTFHVETVEEINPAWFKGCERVGVTAGASTPDAQISAVEEYLESL
ncbi:MAG: 4-hydroxy-3-methylbut-2-enyl diphosphate reductase [Eggerthellaceae bacterium]|jgi:4-hydroxy-3-methylbut-2-enyl diphosphate reductase